MKKDDSRSNNNLVRLNSWAIELKKEKRMRFLQICLIFLLASICQPLFFNMAVMQAHADTIDPPSGRMIDLFTQKKPYDGRGVNKSSDAFAPQSEVILFALVTYNDEPVENMLVSFEVIPPNLIDGYPLHRVISTNASGIAVMSFNLPWPSEHPEETVFGTWSAIANVDIADKKVVDMVTFRVGWIVEIISIATIDEDLMQKPNFAKATCVGAKLHIRNIAMLPKTATIVVIAYDALNDSFDSVMLNDFNLEPGDTYIFSHCFLNISAQAAIGDAMINASAYTVLPSMGGVSYCPEVSAEFVITSRDVAVINLVASPIDVIAGQVVNVTVTVTNKGDETGTFSLSAYYGSFLIQKLLVTSLLPGQTRTIMFFWNTTYVPAGIYTIKAVAETLPGETETENNVYVDDTVTVRVPRIFMLSRELSILILIVAASLALFAMALLLTRKRNNPRPVMLNVDVLPS
jgi:hypothetical protein